MKHYMDIRVQAISESEALVRNCIALFCTRVNPTIDVIEDLKTAVSEAVTNCVVHAYDSNGGEILVKCEIENNILHIEISDKGKGISDIAKAVTPYFTSDDKGHRAGIGFTIMRSFCDSFEVRNNPEGGVCVVLEKNLVNEG